MTSPGQVNRSRKDHLNIRILHSGSKAQDKEIPETVVCRILMFKWSFGPPFKALSALETGPHWRATNLTSRPAAEAVAMGAKIETCIPHRQRLAIRSSGSPYFRNVP